jgi:hypothetical protein
MTSEYYKVTPFGIYCYRCTVPVASNTRSLAYHVREIHKSTPPPDLSKFLDRACDEINALVRTSDILDYVSRGELGFVCGTCGEAYFNKDSLRSHCRRKKCNYDSAQNVHVYSTKCGRVVGPDKITPSHNIDDPTDMLPEKAIHFLEKFVPPDEKLDVYLPHFIPFVNRYNDPVEEVGKLLDYTTDVPNDEILALLLKSGKSWLCDRARFYCGIVPGNLRAALMVFEGNDVCDVAQNTTFHFSRKESTMVPELLSLLRFLWNHPGGVVKRLSTKRITESVFWVPIILTELHLERMDSFRSHPVVFEYCLSLSFFTKRAFKYNQFRMFLLLDFAPDLTAAELDFAP